MPITGGCMCGAVRFSVAGEPLWAAHCHCRDCQRASGADYVSWMGVTRAELTWTGTRGFHNSSPGVTRSFCPACGTPLTYETADLPLETHLYAPTLDDRDLYHPTWHVQWDERVPWLDASRDLPKYPRWSSNSTPIPEDSDG